MKQGRWKLLKYALRKNILYIERKRQNLDILVIQMEQWGLEGMQKYKTHQNAWLWK